MKTRSRTLDAGPSGNVKVIGYRRSALDFSDAYHFFLKLTWPHFFLLLSVIFVLVNLLFALIYWVLPGSVANSSDQNFLSLFFFSVETLATVGYGEMSPAGLTGHLVAAVEILFGLFGVALVTGMVYGRFSKPQARVLFSEKLVVTEFEDTRCLMLRVANERHNKIIEPHASISLVRIETTKEGNAFFRLHDLPLIRSNNPVFVLTWTLIHRIDESSPLHGWTRERLIEASARVTVSLTGHDETISDSVFVLNEYGAETLYFGYRFVDVVSADPSGTRIIDLTKFHDVVPDSGNTV